MGKQTTVTVTLNDVQFTNNGELVLICTPNNYNPKGSYVMNAAQEARLLQRAGLSSVMTLKALVDLSNNTSKLSFIAEERKAGEAWDNGKEGAARKSGIIGANNGGKDWVGFSNHSIELGFAAKMKKAEMALQYEYSNPDAIRGRNVRPTVPVTEVVVPVSETTEAPEV